jgi:hypothetical protein
MNAMQTKTPSAGNPVLIRLELDWARPRVAQRPELQLALWLGQLALWRAP